jgi:hypothetical protein
MALFITSASPDIDATAGQRADLIAGLRAGEDIPACYPVTISSTFQVFRAIAGGKFDGISAPAQVYQGQPVTVFGLGARYKAVDAILDGSKLYGLTANVGELSDASTTKLFRPVSKYDLAVIFVGQTAL